MAIVALAPDLQTERLLLRAHRRDDFAAMVAIWSDADVVRHISGVPASAEVTWARLLRYRGHWALLGFGYWAVQERASGAFLGDVGLADCQRGLAGFDGLPEAGWVLARSAHGKGYATEAMHAVLDWAAVNITESRSYCLIAPDHAGSIRVAEKLGYSPAARLPYHGQDSLVMARG